MVSHFFTCDMWRPGVGDTESSPSARIRRRDSDKMCRILKFEHRVQRFSPTRSENNRTTSCGCSKMSVECSSRCIKRRTIGRSSSTPRKGCNQSRRYPCCRGNRNQGRLPVDWGWSSSLPSPGSQVRNEDFVRAK